MATAFLEKKAVSAAANLLRSMGATQVYIFGSAAKGGLRPDSNVDMAVTGLRHTDIFPPSARPRTSSAGRLTCWTWIIRRPSFVTSSAAESWFVSRDLAKKFRLGLGELATVREHITPILALPADGTVGVIERAAACAMLHSFYTEIEKMLKLVAREWDVLTHAR